ncbi:MAG: hypothetical protein HOO97_05590 [Sideroxydans sp.]|nr:hypothetical protein [Sideroxydans sp.]
MTKKTESDTPLVDAVIGLMSGKRRIPKEFQDMAAKIREKCDAQAEEKLKPRIKRAAEDYAALPAEIRASIAKRAGVANKRLDELSLSDRRRLRLEADRLVEVLKSAWVLLVDVS